MSSEFQGIRMTNASLVKDTLSSREAIVFASLGQRYHSGARVSTNQPQGIFGTVPAVITVTGQNMVKILAIDDDKSQLQLLRRILGERHYSVALAQNEQDALKLMERKRPLVVLSDLKIPRTDGFALLARLRQIDPDAGFIVVTGYGSPENQERARQLGVTRFLEKPLSLNTLIDAVRELVCERRVSETRSRLRLYHGGSCPFGSCILKGSRDSCSYFGCPYRE